MPPATRLADNTAHGTPTAPGPGSPDVLIGFKPAWRALPSSVGGAVESASNAVNSFMTTPVTTPASAAPQIAQISTGLTQAAAASAAEGNAQATAQNATALVTLNSTNVALTATWTAASAVPGGQPAANTAYTEGIKGAMAAAASQTFSAIGGMADTHICPMPVPIPPHGPGMVTKGASTVVINNLPACRVGDKIFEACGGPDPFVMGEPTVLIDDQTGSGSEGSLSYGDAQEQTAEQLDDQQSEETPVEALVAEESFAGAAYYGTALVERCTPCDGV